MEITKDAYYFSHDSNAKDDPKCVDLIESLGLEGYGIFWVIIEILRDQPEYKYPLKLLPALARKYNTTFEKVKAVVFNYGLFQLEDDEKFFSESLNRRMGKLADRREKNKKAIEARWQKQKLLSSKNTDVIQTNYECNTDVLPTYYDRNTSKVKESKVQYSKVDQSKVKHDLDHDLDQKSKKQQDEGEIFQFFSNNICPISPFQSQIISTHLDEGMEPKLILEVLKDSVGKSEKWTWVKKVLENNVAKGVYTFEKYVFEKNNRDKKTDQVQASKLYPKFETTEEEYLDFIRCNPPKKNPFIDEGDT